jgi:F-type H+-transporting ATPase subunit b
MAADPHAAEAAAHGGEHAGAFPPFDATLFAHQLVWFALIFGALYLILSRVALPRVAAVLERRAATVQGDLEAAHKASEAAEAARVAGEQARAKAHAEARKLIDDMRAEGAKTLAEEQAKADAVLADKAAAAETRIDAARAQALSNVQAMADSLSRDIVAKLLPANLSSGGARA